MPPIESIIAEYRKQGWNDEQSIRNDINAGNWQSKMPAGFTGTGIPTFNFDYAGEAQKAYGELGVYYDRLLRESQGDLNKVLTRLTEDYDRGLRVRRESNEVAQEGYDIAEQNAGTLNTRNALARGVMNLSAYDPATGTGVPVQNMQQRLVPINRARAASNRSLANFEEESAITLNRNREDLPLKQSRYEADLERKRRVEAGQLADTRGARAYNKFLAEFGA